MSEPPRYPQGPSEPVDPHAGEPGRPRPRPAQQPPNGQPVYGDPAYGQPLQQPGYGTQGNQYGQPGGPPGWGPTGSGPSGSGPSGSGSSGRLRLAERIGPRLARRPEPRFGVTLAAVGVGLTIFGIAVIGGQGGDSAGGGRKAIGIVLSLALVAVAYGVLYVRRNGPLSTTGVAASALGVPLLLLFICDAADLGSSAVLNIVVLLSLVAWLGSYLLAPGAQGHVFYLGAFAFTLWAYVIDKIDSGLPGVLVFLPLSTFRPSVDDGGNGSSFGFTSFPDFNAIATVSILFGVAYYLVAFLLDRTGRSGPSVAFVVAGLPATVVGLAVAAVKAPQWFEGALIIVAGVVLGLLGARTGRRFTTWFWTLGVAVGIIVILEDVVGDDDTAAGISLIVLGLLVVVLAQLVATALSEPDETVPTPPRTGAPPVA